jgi:hypothetical protein
MLYGLFRALGTLTRLVVSSGLLRALPAVGQTRRGGRRHSGAGSGLLEELLGLTDSRLSAAAVTAAAETGRAILERPGVRASLEGAVLRLLGVRGEQLEASASVRERVSRIACILQERGGAVTRLAIDGLPGSGKSTLARALAERLGLEWTSLDHQNMNVAQDFASRRTVYEHHRLLRTQDVDVFEAIVYVNEAVEICKARVVQRARVEARSALITEVLDYDKLSRVGKLAFDVCAGQTIPISGGTVLLKIRPAGGFRAAESIARRLCAAGHAAEAMSKEEMLLLLADGKPASGLMAYFMPGAFRQEVLQGLLAGLRKRRE